MATHTCNQNCGCTNSYTVTAPCPPACPEVFNSQCIVYTGTDITCNTDTVIKRYDYLDTVITKLVNYICNTVGPVTQVVGSPYIDVVPNTVGNVTTYTVSIDIPALQAYFDTVFQNDILASILAGPGISISQNPIAGTVTVTHQDTSSVANVNSDNSGNSFIQDIFFTFDTFGHVTGASVVPGSVIPPNDFDRAQINPDSGFVWGPANDPTNIQIAEAPGDTLNFVAGTGITLNASTVPSTDAIRITNTDPGSAVTLGSVGSGETIVNDGVGPALFSKSITSGAGISVTANATDLFITNIDRGSDVTLTSAGGTETLVNDGTGLGLATKGLTAGNGISLSGSATAVTIAASLDKFVSGALVGTQPVVHGLATLDVIVSVKSGTLPLPFASYVHGVDYTYTLDTTNQITITELISMGTYTVTVIG